jgi:hypothetical protein
MTKKYGLMKSLFSCPDNKILISFICDSVIKILMVVTCVLSGGFILRTGAQVTISPTAMYIDDSQSIESLQISNANDAAREVFVSFEFGYPSADSAGNFCTVYDDTLKKLRYGIGTNARAFPRKFILQPGGQQIVRVQILNMRDKRDGVYWERMIITSRESAGINEKLNIIKGVGAAIECTFRQSIPLFYLKGLTTTGVIIEEVTAYFKEGILTTVSKLVPEGNSPFNGSVTLDLKDESGRLVASHRQTVTLYFESYQRIEMNLSDKGLHSGRYSLEFLYKTERDDVPASNIVKAEPVRHAVSIDINNSD